jgi:hypothetical protein
MYFSYVRRILTSKSKCEKTRLHINGAKRRRVLMGDKLGWSEAGISTNLSTLVLKS